MPLVFIKYRNKYDNDSLSPSMESKIFPPDNNASLALAIALKVLSQTLKVSFAFYSSNSKIACAAWDHISFISASVDFELLYKLA